MKRLLLVAFAIAALFPVSAFAADLGQPVYKSAPPPPPAPVYNWTGCYVGAGVGYGVADINHSTTDNTGQLIFDSGHDNAAKGWLGMVGTGCDVQFATSWVVGVTGDFQFGDVKGQYSFNCPSPCLGPSGYVGGIEEPWSWGVGGRAGYLVSPQLLTYWTAGFTQTRLNQVTYVDQQFGEATGLVLPAQTYDGWYLGGGVEYAIGWVPGLFWRTEYRYASYDTRNISQLCGSIGCGGAGTVNSIDRVRPQEQTIWSALVYRFNWFGH
jgi:outer membrane immunogenic protein